MNIFALLLMICLAINGIYFLLFPHPKANPALKLRLLADVILLVQQTKSRRRKIQIIKTNMCPALSGIIRLNYDKNLILDVDPDIEYKERGLNDSQETLNHSSKIWNSFLNSSPHTRRRKNLRLKGILEAVDSKEAKLFIDAINHQIDLGITFFTLKKCFPKTFTGKL